MHHPDKEINDILEKTRRIFESDEDKALSEMTLKGLLQEAIDQKDIQKVSNAIDDAAVMLNAVLNYFDAIQGFENKIPTTLSYVESLVDALKSARSELATVSFDQGAVSSFMGEKIALPQITQAAIAIHTKASDFGLALKDSVEKIMNNLTPMLKDKDATKTLRELSGQDGVPEDTVLHKGISSSMNKSFGGGFFNKVKNFFKMTFGKEKKILSQLPTFDPKILANEIADALLDTPAEAFMDEVFDVPDVDSSELNSVSAEAKEEEEALEREEEKSDKTDASSPEPLKDEKEAEKEQDNAQQELTSAVQDEMRDSQSPADAAFGAIDSWAGSLSKSSQKSLTTKNRVGDLKGAIGSALDNSVKAVEGEVAAAIQSWRDDHEEALMKSKRFAKKNFDSLQNLVPKLAASMLKKTNESKLKMSKDTVRVVVYEFLDRKFYRDEDRIITEYKYTENEMRAYRLNKLAGLE